MIGGNGSYVEDHGHVVMHQMITPEQCRHIVDWLKECGLEFYLESNAGLFASAGFEEAGEPVIQEYSRRKGKEGADKIKVRDAFPEMIFDGELYRDDVNKVSFILNQYQDYKDAVTEFSDLQAGTWGGAGEIALFGDLGVKNITKGQCHCASVRISSCRCGRYNSFWGCKVDIPMLEYCGYGVAMGSGGDEIKAMADYVTGDVDKNGCMMHLKNWGCYEEKYWYIFSDVYHVDCM